MNTAAENTDPRYMLKSAHPPEQPLLSEAMDRLRKVHSILCEADSATTNLRQRLFGSWPANVTDVGRDDGSIKRELTEAEQLLNLIAHLGQTAANVCENANALNGKV